MAEVPAESFAAVLLCLRKRAGLTQEKLADAAGLHYRSISDLERGINHTPHKETARLNASGFKAERLRVGSVLSRAV